MMDDGDIINLVDQSLSRYAESTATLISMEIDNVRHEVKGVKDEFIRMNGSLREVCKWKEQQEGRNAECRDRKDHSFKTIMAIIAFVSVFSGIAFGIVNLNKKIDKIARETEGQSIMMIEDRGFGSGNHRGYIDSLIVVK